MVRTIPTIKINMKELANIMLEDFSISVDENGCVNVIGNIDFFHDLIDQYLGPRTPDKMIIKNGALKDLIDELLFFMQNEVYIRMQKAMSKLDAEENKILINENKEYECEQDGR